LDALSEHSVEWERALRRWRRRHRRLRTLVNGRLVPTRTADNFVYQALLGLWTCRPERSEGPAFSRATAKEQDLRSAQDDISHRLTAYVQKAMREAKVSTSWTDPDAQFEDAIAQFLGRLLDRSTNADWMREVDDFVATLAPQTLWNALGRLVVHLTAPGVPDLYQGDELWFAALVDPDNRRPVDWADRAAALDVAERAATSPERGAQLIHWRDTMQASELKMFVIRELLAFRRDHAQLLSCGGYERVEVAGVHADNIFAFRRFSAGEEVVVAVPRFTRALGPVVAGSAWGDTRLVVGADSATEWTCLIHGAARVATHGVLAASECFSELPVAVLQRNRLREPFVS
jgi:(1->4)-alpha-D-glucan 1-alpha-D-glucosylmutase